jgi:hypothetical protein
LNKNASQEQTDALSKIFSGSGFFAAAAKLIGEMIGTKSAPFGHGLTFIINAIFATYPCNLMTAMYGDNYPHKVGTQLR